MRCWLKFVGVTEGPLPDDWLQKEPSLLDIARFPKHRKPTNISNYEMLVLYAVVKQKVFAVQRRAGSIRINKPYGPVGSVTHRWPHEMEAETFGFVPNLLHAPQLPDVLPDFMDKYRKKFRHGSHWEITPEEFAALQRAILKAGEGTPVPPPPSLQERGFL